MSYIYVENKFITQQKSLLHASIRVVARIKNLYGGDKIEKDFITAKLQHEVNLEIQFLHDRSAKDIFMNRKIGQDVKIM